jgi:hypothetical protein
MRLRCPRFDPTRDGSTSGFGRGSVNAEPQSVVSALADATHRAVSETANQAPSEVQVSATNGVPDLVTTSSAKAARFDSAPNWLLAHGVIRTSANISNVHGAASIFGAREPWPKYRHTGACS